MAFEFTQVEVDALNASLGLDMPLEKANALASEIDIRREALRLAQSNHANLVSFRVWLAANGGANAQIDAVQTAIDALAVGWGKL